MALFFCDLSLSIMIGLLCITKSVLEFITVHMQITDFPLYALVSIDFNAVDECGPGALYSIFDIEML